MLKGFKDFLLRGNVIELAVAVIIGTAFTAVVTAIADHLIRPMVAAIGGAKVSGLSWQLVTGNKASTIDFASVITAALNFMIIASIVYFLFIVPMKTVQERRKRGEEPGPAEPTDVEVLLEIRDLLRQQQLPQPMSRGGDKFPSGPARQPGPGGPAPGGPVQHGPGPAGPPPGPGPRNW